MNKPRAIFVGRWCPFHKGHFAIMQEKIDAGVPLLVLIRDTAYDAYPAKVRKRMVDHALAKQGIDAVSIIIPDIESVNYGRGVGYEINEVEVPSNIQTISATKIRKALAAADESWKNIVVPGVDEIIEEYEKAGKGRVIWFTGLPCSGKTTIAKELEKKLRAEGKKVATIDGDLLRSSPISKGLGFSKEDRRTNLHRAAYMCRKLAEAGQIIIASFVSPYEDIRSEIKEIIAPQQFDIVFVNTPVEECERRDTKGMYAKARKGEIKEFTGVSDPYEAPETPSHIINTSELAVDECVNTVISNLKL